VAPHHAHLDRTLRSVAALVLAGLGGCGTDSEPAAPPLPVGTEPGQRAPAIAGLTPTGEEFTIQTARGAPLVLVFYRSIECGLCQLQLEQMQSNLAAYRRSRAEVAAITLDEPARTREWVERASLAFPVISVDTAAFRLWGALASDDSRPLPASYVIDGSGVIRFRHIGRNAADRASDAEIVTILESLSDP